MPTTKTRTPRRRSRASAMPASSTPMHTPPAASPTSAAPASSPVPHLLTVDEVAEMLRTSRKGIYALIYKGALPGVIRLHRRLLIDRADLVKWLNQSRTVSLTTQGVQ